MHVLNVMKLDRLPQHITTAIGLLVGIIIAVLCGRLTGAGQLGLIGLLGFSVGFLVLCIGLRAKTWLLLPLTWEVTGLMPFLPVPFSVRDLTIMVVVGSYLIFYALKVIRSTVRLDAIYLLIIINMAYLTTVFVRNPVGLDAFGSEMVGGRPYFTIGMAFLSFWVLVRAPATIQEIRMLPVLLLMGSAVVSLASLVIYVAPGAAMYLGQFYTGFVPLDDLTQEEDVTGRKLSLSVIGNAGSRVMCSYFPPITFLVPVYPLRFAAAMGSFLCVLLAGFRSAFVTAVIFIGLSTYFRRRYQDLVIFALAGVCLITVVGIGNGRLFNLPLSVQRALSFLPGNWDYLAVSSARGSSEWRYEMWRMVWKEEKWIKNRWLGDGFGFSHRELGMMLAAREGAGNTLGGVMQEEFMIVGSYHNGPLSSIRYVGAVGFALYLALIVVLAVRGWRLIVSTRDMTIFPVALFVGMPAIIAPPVFLFMVGGYDSNLPETLFLAGIIRLLERARDSEAPGLTAGSSTLTDMKPTTLYRPRRPRAQEALPV